MSCDLAFLSVGRIEAVRAIGRTDRERTPCAPWTTKVRTIARNEHARRPTPWRVVFCEKMKNQYGMAEGPGSARSPATKERYGGYRLGAERLRWLSQILKKCVRQLEIRGFESFREAVVHESQRMPSVIALTAFAEQAGQGHR